MFLHINFMIIDRQEEPSLQKLTHTYNLSLSFILV